MPGLEYESACDSRRDSVSRTADRGRSRNVIRRGFAGLQYGNSQAAEFQCEHDHFRLLGEDNIRRYVAIREVRIRVDRRDSWFEIFARACAAKAAGCRITVSTPPGEPIPAVRLLDDLTDAWAAGIEFVEETDARLGEVMRQRQTQRLRFAAPDRVPPALRQVAAETGIYIADAPVLIEGTSSCSGICASRASATSITATAISARAARNRAPSRSNRYCFAASAARIAASHRFQSAP